MLLVLGGAFYGVVKAPFFTIQGVDVVGVEEAALREKVLAVAEESIAADAWGRFLGSRHYLAWPHILAVDDPQIALAEIDKQLFERRIQIIVTRRAPYAIWCFDGSEMACVWVDEEGIVLRDAPEPNGSLILSFYDLREASPRYGIHVIEPELFSRIRQFGEALKSLSLSVERMVLDTFREELRVETSGGSYILFSLLTEIPAEAVRVLGTFLERNSFERIEYIDLTVENKIYVKRK